MVLYRCLCWFLFSETNSHTNQLSLVERHLHDTICTIEQQIEQGQFSGSVCRVYELIERCSSSRPVCNFSNFTYINMLHRSYDLHDFLSYQSVQAWDNFHFGMCVLLKFCVATQLYCVQSKPLYQFSNRRSADKYLNVC